MATASTKSRARVALVAALWAGAMLFGLTAPRAWGQVPFGAIEGLVRDESGAVLPGVTVEATSPALLEGARTVVSDGSGKYQFLRLPVGQYTIKFSLTGFKAFSRENVVINASFTATINGDLAVGALEETLTVTGQSPLVDVRTTTVQTVVTSEVANTIPSSRNLTDMSRFVLGASTTSPDVGGSSRTNYTPIKIHGSRSSDRSNYVDGFSANGLFGTGDTPVAFNASGGAREEIDYQTTAIPASFPYGGVAMSAVSKSGGNRMSGEFFAGVQAWQSDNLDDKLRSLGVRATSGSRGARDIDGSIGGPLKKDRMWIFGSVRHNVYQGLVANSFFPDGSQMTDDDRREAYFAKISLKVNQSNNLAFPLTSDTHERPYRRSGANFVTPEAANHNFFTPNLFAGVAWTGTRGNAFLYEISASDFFRGSPQAYRDEVGPNDVPHLDIVTSVLSVAPTSIMDTDQHVNTLSGSITRVGSWLGSHELRTGVQSNWGYYAQEWNWHGDIILRYRNGVPDSVDLTNTPTGNNVHVANTGIYLQDAWRINRVTFNVGTRYDEFHSWTPIQRSPAGTWVPAREYPAKSLKPFRTIVPRLGVAYDLTGDARTVLKGNFSKYIGNEGISLAESQNPPNLSMNRCAWTDRNGDLLAQASEIDRCAGFTEGVTTVLDPNLRRSYNNEYSLGVQRQLTANFAGSVTYYRREQRDLRGTFNRAVPTATYIPVVITNPLDNQPLTIYNQDPATAGRQDNIVSNSDKLDTAYNGIELTIQRRFTTSAYLQAGYQYGKDRGRIATGDLNDPNNDIFGDGAVGTDEPHQVKVSAVFVLPGQISVSGFLQAYSGHPRARSLAVGRTIVPTLTRATQTIRLEPNDANRYPNQALVDLRLGRRFRVGGWRFEAFADIFNLTNANTVVADVVTIGSSLGQISETIRPRVVRFGGKFGF